MEVWALEVFGIPHILQGMFAYKSDHIRARQEVLGTMIIGGTVPNYWVHLLLGKASTPNMVVTI